MNRTYSVEERAEAVALASSVGPVKAAEALGYPRRTVASWLHKRFASPIIREAETAIAERLTEAHREALAAVRASLADPKARLGDKAQALRVLGEQSALAEGRATSRSESLNLNINASVLTPEESREARRYAQALLEKLDAGELDEVEQAVAANLQAEAHLQALLDAGVAADVDSARDMLVTTGTVLNVLRARQASRRGWSDGLG